MLQQWTIEFVWVPDQLLPRCVSANQVPSLVPHFILRGLDRFEVLLTSSFSHWGSNSPLSLLRAQALCFADSVLCAFTAASTYLEEYELGVTTWRSFLLWCFSVGFQHVFAHFSARNSARICSTRSVSRLVSHTSMASGMCPKPCSSFDFQARFLQWPFESL